MTSHTHNGSDKIGYILKVKVTLGSRAPYEANGRLRSFDTTVYNNQPSFNRGIQISMFRLVLSEINKQIK